LIVSGDKSGSMAIWDINTGQCIKQMNTVHQGSISKIKFHSDGQQSNIILSAGLKDGFLAVHDMRSNKLVAKSRVHKAAINLLETSLSGFAITGSADKTVKTYDILNGFKPISVMNTTDAVFCGKVL